LSGLHVAAQLRHKQAKRVQRLAQIMARRSEEARFREVCNCKLLGAFLDLAFKERIGVLQLFRHAVELVGQRFKLVAGPYRNALSEMPAAVPAAAPPRPLDCTHLPRSEEQPGQEG